MSESDKVAASSAAQAEASSTTSGSGCAPAYLDLDWQYDNETVGDKIAAMFERQLMTDFTFIVGEVGNSKTLAVHKIILAMSSPVFYAMFNGGLAPREPETVIPDIEPTIFLSFLKYLYTDKIDLNEDTVLPILYVANKYLVVQLEQTCVSYLITNTTANNAFLYLKQSLIYGKPKLEQRCWSVIQIETEKALNSSVILEIDLTMLKSVLAQKTLNCKEIKVFEAACAWAQVECLRKGMDPTGANLRAVLDSALYSIRFPTMTQEEFASGVAELGILTQQEIVDIFMHFSSISKESPFPLELRKKPTEQICSRFTTQAVRHRNNNHHSREIHTLIFWVDKAVYIIGFGIYCDNSTYSVKIELKESNRVIAAAENEKRHQPLSNGVVPTDRILRIYFPNPVQIRAMCKYSANVICEYFSEIQGRAGVPEKVTAGPVTFKFQNCSNESSNNCASQLTTVSDGQIPEIIYFNI